MVKNLNNTVCENGYSLERAPAKPIKIAGARGWQRARFFPFQSQSHKAYKFSAIVGIGANIGDVSRRFTRLVRKWLDDPRIGLVATSPLLKNAAFGYTNQADFLNSVALIRTSLAPAKLLSLCLHYERRFGRKRSFKNAPRTLDLDILYHTQKVRPCHRLRLPHPGASSRISVLLPLGQI